MTCAGRVWSVRKAGKKLVFVDIVQDGSTVQCIFDQSKIIRENLKSSDFKGVVQDLHKGDSISKIYLPNIVPLLKVAGFTGHPHRTDRNELSIVANKLPVHLSRCVRDLPGNITNQETKMQSRYVDFLVDPRGLEILRLRSEILDVIRQFLKLNEFVDVQTPILADAAGGATARPFQTVATEFENRKLAMRIAPELWLKKLIIGGFERVFEIGPSFRNEGKAS